MAIMPIVQRPAGPSRSSFSASRPSRGSYSPAGIPPVASHAYTQAPTLPPIIRSQAPAHYQYPSHFSPSSQRPSQGSYSPAGVAPIPRASTVPPAPQQSPVQRLAQVLGATKTANPWETSGVKAAVQGQILSTWFALRAKGLLPNTAVPPKIIFDSHDTPGVGAYVMKVPGSPNSELHVPPTFAKGLTHPTDAQFANWARDTIVHELAHTGQRSAAWQSKAMAEGGAQTFAQNAAPQVFKNTYVPLSQGAYGEYVNQVQAREPNQWVMHGQFAPGAHAPEVNMPGSSAFRSAMSGVGRSVGRSAQDMATRANYLAQPRKFPIGSGGELLGAIAGIPGWAATSVGYKVRRNK